MTPEMMLLSACLAMVALVAVVGTRMLIVRVSEMKEHRIHPQSIATSTKAASRFLNVQAADNFRNLFEVPVLFYALAAIAVALGDVPTWLVVGAWSFVVLRYIHSFIQCTYNKVMHRFAVFGCSFVLIVVLWMVFVISLSGDKFAA